MTVDIAPKTVAGYRQASRQEIREAKSEKGVEIMGVAADTICRCMKKKKLRQKTVAASLNENPRQINQQLRRMDDIKVERFCKYADALGYDVAVIDRESGEVEKLDPAKNNL